MKKVAVVTNGLSGGGAERVASLLANYFDDNGYEVMFVAAYSPEKEYALNDSIRYEYLDIKSKTNHLMRLVERSIKLYKVVRKFKADVVFSFITNELVPLALSRTKLIPSLRTDPYNASGDFAQRNIRKFVFRHADKIVFQTTGARDFYGDKIRKKGVIISNPINNDLPEWNIDNHSKTFITACRIKKEKNITMLINAFKRFHCVHPDYKLEIYGAGEPAEYKDQMEQYSREQGTDEYIKFMGHSSNIYKIMQDAQGFILTSNYEGISNSMLESLAIGLPAICTDCPPGGARQFITDGKTGLLVPVNGEDEIVDALCRLVEDKELQRSISLESRYVRQELNKDSICKQWENLI